MSRFELNLATPEDDEELRQVLAATPMDGKIRLAFAREPSYFGASAVEGEFVQVGVIRDKKSWGVVGFASRAVSSCYVNGEIEDVGYISALRLMPDYRRKLGLLARGYQFFREMHQDGKTPYYLTTIAEDNVAALELLTSQRAGLPIYHPLGRYHTLTIDSGQRCGPEAECQVEIRRAGPSDGERIAGFLHREGPKRQFFPNFLLSEFEDDGHRLTGLSTASILVAEQHGKVVGTIGVWDQRSFRQIVVHGYSPALRLVRPLYNVLAKVSRMPRLPPAGNTLNCRYAAVPVVANADADVARALVREALGLVRQQEGDCLLLGLHEEDPLLPIIRPLSGRKYTTLVFLVYWKDERPDMLELSRRVPYLELGCL